MKEAGRNLWFLKPRAVPNLILSACSWRWVASVIYGAVFHASVIYGAVFPVSFLGFGHVRGRYIRIFKKNINSTPKPPCFSCFYRFDLLVAKSGQESSWFCSYPELEDFIWSQKLNRFHVSEARKSYSLLFSLGFSICVILAGIITSHAGFGGGMGNECWVLKWQEAQLAWLSWEDFEGGWGNSNLIIEDFHLFLKEPGADSQS